MEPHIWRVPTLFGVMACSALVLFAACVVGSVVTRRGPSRISKVVTAGTLALLAVLSAIAIRATAGVIARSLETTVTDVDPGPIAYLVPPAYAAFAFAVGQRLLGGAWTSRPALLFYAWLLGFTVANVINRCTPGWCATVGFPLAWYAWSDSLVTFGNERFEHFIEALGKALGAVIDLFIFVVVASLLTRERVRGQPRPPG